MNCLSSSMYSLIASRPLDREHRLAVERDRVGHPADRHVLDVRGLAAEDGDDLVGLALDVERLQVVGDRQQVDLGRQLHRRVAPVAVGEDAELAAADQGGEPLLGRGLDLDAVVRPRRQALGQVGGRLRDRP
jgi:hypothetical protein